MLISVKNLTEARIAMAVEGVSIVDVKDPLNGSLGFAGADVINAVAADVAMMKHGRPSAAAPMLSIAMGELADHQPQDLNSIVWDNVDYAKFGLAGMYGGGGGDEKENCDGDWRRAWREAFSKIPDHVARVMVMYVDLIDFKIAAAMLNDLAGANTVLLDTFDKTNGNAFAHWSVDDCKSIFRLAQSKKLLTVMAGSIGVGDLDNARQTGAAMVGVRGAVCQGPREGALSVDRLKAMVKQCGPRFGKTVREIGLAKSFSDRFGGDQVVSKS